MMRGSILHPELLAGVAEVGHGGRILIADALYPHSTGVPAAARRVHLNLAPGLVAAADILSLVAESLHLEAAAYMRTAEGEDSEAVRSYRDLLAEHRHAGGETVSWHGLERHDFYQAARQQDTSLLIASGETKPYANLLLTVGVP